mmetsp:Transcript_82785/g.267937  ORF Transcript_82785/g.267937 Transcript_82785/m.267937 type:complete len:236 (-) Transcript_82785:905-1612(-)
MHARGCEVAQEANAGDGSLSPRGVRGHGARAPGAPHARGQAPALPRGPAHRGHPAGPAAAGGGPRPRRRRGQRRGGPARRGAAGPGEGAGGREVPALVVRALREGEDPAGGPAEPGPRGPHAQPRGGRRLCGREGHAQRVGHKWTGGIPEVLPGVNGAAMDGHRHYDVPPRAGLHLRVRAPRRLQGPPEHVRRVGPGHGGRPLLVAERRAEAGGGARGHAAAHHGAGLQGRCLAA